MPADEREEMVSRYERIVGELRSAVDHLFEELRGLERSGAAEEHPERHERALQKMEQIEDEIAALEQATDTGD